MNKNLPYIIIGGIAVGNYLLPTQKNRSAIMIGSVLGGGIAGYMLANNLNKNKLLFSTLGLALGYASIWIFNGEYGLIVGGWDAKGGLLPQSTKLFEKK
jgi:hypothetical protein